MCVRISSGVRMDVFDLFNQTPSNSSPSKSQETASEPTPEEPLQNDDTASLNTQNGLLSAQNGLEVGFSDTPSMDAPKETVILSIPGALVFRKGSFHLAWLTNLSRRVDALHKSGKNVALVVGESPHSRLVGKTARQLGLPVNEIEAHIASSSFLNAALVLRLLSNAHPQVCEELQDAVNALQNGSIAIVMGGKESTTAEARAAMLAEKTNGKCVILTETAIPTNTFSHARFAKMANEAAQEGEAAFVVDPLTSLVLARGKVETILLWGKHLKQLNAALEGNDFDGTRIAASVANDSVDKKKIWKE